MIKLKLVMKLFFDARYTRTDYHDGISRYSAELGNALAKLTPVTFLICDEAQKKWFPKDAKCIKIHPGTSIKEPFTAFILNRYRPDVVYSPMQTIGTLGRKYTSVLTVHDMIYYRHPNAPKFLSWPIRAGWWLYHQAYWPQRLILKGGDIITTVSTTSAEDLRQARMTNKPIQVVYNAPQQFAAKATHKKTIENIVYMGSFMPYKNVETLIKSMEWLPERTLHLLSRIRPERKAELETLVPDGARVIFYNGVSDEQYEKLLADNALLATASYDEGFGIPVAEAMAMGTPVVISDLPIFHEVGGNGALYFNPSDPRGFAACVEELNNDALRKQLAVQALVQINKFNWETSAKVLLAVINQK